MKPARRSKNPLADFLRQLEQPEVKAQVFAEVRRGLSFWEQCRLDVLEFEQEQVAKEAA